MKTRRIKGPFLAGGVPYLGLDGLLVDDERFGLKLDANGGFRIDVELVLGEAREELGLPHGGVSDQHHLEHVVDLVVVFAVQVRHHPRGRRIQSPIVVVVVVVDHYARWRKVAVLLPSLSLSF